MKITTLSEQLRRADAGRSVPAPMTRTFKASPAATLSARKATAWTGDSWTVAAGYEPRPPLAAKAWSSQKIQAKSKTAPDALRAAEDDGWPPASSR